MPPRTKQQRLFGAACLKLQLEKAGALGVGASSIYEGALQDLGLTDEDVTLFLESSREQVEQALRQKGSKSSLQKA